MGLNCILFYIFQIYRELEDASKHRVVYHSKSAQGRLQGVPVNAHYQHLGVLDRKRLLARRSNTTYCYDFPLVILSNMIFMFFFFLFFLLKWCFSSSSLLNGGKVDVQLKTCY